MPEPAGFEHQAQIFSHKQKPVITAPGRKPNGSIGAASCGTKLNLRFTFYDDSPRFANWVDAIFIPSLCQGEFDFIEGVVRDGAATLGGMANGKLNQASAIASPQTGQLQPEAEVYTTSLCCGQKAIHFSIELRSSRAV